MMNGRGSTRRRWTIGLVILAISLVTACDALVGMDPFGTGGQGDPGVDDGDPGGDPTDAADGVTLEGTISSDLTLERDTRYSVTGNVTVQAALTVEPGAILEFAADTRLLIDDVGVIRAIGTAGDPIVFRGATQTAGFWRGVLVYSDDAQNRLEHVEILHTGSAAIGGQTGAVVLDGSRAGGLALVSVTLATGAGHGLVVEDGATLFEFTTGTFGDLADTPLLIVPDEVAKLDDASSFLSTNADNRVEIDRFGSVTSNAEWPDPGVPYFVTDELDVAAELTIRPGTRFEFGASVRMEIDPGGALIADASAGEPIVFTGDEETPGYWRGIQIESSNTSSVMDNVEVSYAGEQDGFSGSEEGNVYLYDGTEPAYLLLRNSTISNGASHGVVYDSNTTLTDDGTNTTTPFASVTMTNIGDDLSGFSDYHVP